MASIRQLSPAHCVLLATHYAAESHIDALRTLSLARPDAFSPETLLRILLTFLPESAEPSTYNAYAEEVASRLYTQQRLPVDVDPAPVKDLTNSQAQKRADKLKLLPLAHESCAGLDLDLLTLFFIHRAYRIDAETGLLTLVPPLVDAFLDRSQYLRAWFVSTVLPLLRLEFEYYPHGDAATSLEYFGRLQGSTGVDFLVKRAEESSTESDTDDTRVARDIKGIIGPWMYGFEQRKSRKVHEITRRRSSVGSAVAGQIHQGEDAAPGAARSHHDWEHVYAWMVRKAPHHFDLIVSAVEHWDGPGDVDLGGYDDPSRQDGLDEGTQSHLERRYAQAAFASVYSVEHSSRSMIEAAHAILVRLAHIMHFIPPPDLASSVEMLPRIEGHASILHQTTPAILQPDTLLHHDHPLTVPTVETFALLQIFVYSAYILADLGHPISLNNLAKFRFHSDEDDQLQLAKKILDSLSNRPKTDEEMWRSTRSKLLWLWDWGMDSGEEHAANGPGVLGKIARFELEEAILTTFLKNGQSPLAINVFIPENKPRDHLQDNDIEECVLRQIMWFYDNAESCKVTQGNLKKALDILTAFQPHFSDSHAFLATEALFAAIHSLSFYSFKVRNNTMPFRPYCTHISKDPIWMMRDLLQQNPGSYAKLDDLVTIGQNLVAAGALDRSKGPPIEQSEADMEQCKRVAARRITGMAIEAALAEDDFETAYSFVVNRLNASFDPAAAAKANNKSNKKDADEDEDDADQDLSWRAAYLAGRHRSANAPSTAVSSGSTSSPALRRLEQRMELLSQALLLAPPAALPEVLTAWRRGEEEMAALLARETEEQDRFDDHADQRAPGAFPAQPAPYVQPRREVGRNAAEEAPMGLFDVARGAAAAFSRSAFAGKGEGGPVAGRGAGVGVESGRSSVEGARGAWLEGPGSDAGSGTEEGGGRVRKRDMVTSAVTGGLASGIGWVLGATPVAPNQQQQRE